MCTDVTVRHGAVCHTDHQLVCDTVWLGLVRFGKRLRRCSTSGRFDVNKLLVCRGESTDVPDDRGFVESVLARAGADWEEDGGVDDKWLAVWTALCTSTEELLGRSRRRQPDWFQESLGILVPLLTARNVAYSRWLDLGQIVDLVSFQKARGAARWAVRQTKNT